MTVAKRALGSTGIDVSCLGLGTVKFGRNQEVKYPSSFALPSDREVEQLLAEAQELGINLIRHRARLRQQRTAHWQAAA
jgi:aryl-alcohol dehydrogenase-like predicted oxidoreductase